MTSVVTWSFLAVSVVALGAQTVSLVKLLYGGPPVAVGNRNLIRTVTCRVAVAILYVGLGVTALQVTSATAGIIALACFGFTQCLWLANSILDIRLVRRSTAASCRPTSQR